MTLVVYILYSKNLDCYYIGHTQNLGTRLNQHNSQVSKSTKKTNDWEIVYQECFETRSAAVHRELAIKRKKSRKYIEMLLNKLTYSFSKG